MKKPKKITKKQAKELMKTIAEEASKLPSWQDDYFTLINKK